MLLRTLFGKLARCSATERHGPRLCKQMPVKSPVFPRLTPADTPHTLPTRTILLSGDHLPNVRAVAHAVGITEARAVSLPGNKVTVVTQLARAGRHVMMVDDGTNDAQRPADPAVSSASGNTRHASGEPPRIHPTFYLQ